VPLHHQSKEKEIQKKRNIKLRKIDKRKRKMFSSPTHHNINTLTPAFFISSTAFITSSFFASDFLIFSIISFSVSLTNHYFLSIALISNHSFFNITWFSLSLSTPSA